MSDFYRFPTFGERQRSDACSLCALHIAPIVGRMNYTGLGEWDVVQCPQCGLISLDPMPGIDIIEQGCKRLYLVQQSGHSRRRVLKYFSRTYRRGGHFALHHLKKLGLPASPSLLEIGAGNGYFSQGVAAIFPDARVHYLDVMEDLIAYYHDHFDCEAVAGELTADAFPGHQFDLIIARDILEHVRDPMQTLRDIHALLRPGGLLFFITPNGLEDFWTCSQRYKHSGAATLIWQNHFHYFLPQTLHRMLAAAGFHEEIAFKWNLELHRKGMGHAGMPELGPVTPPEFGERPPAEPPSKKWRHRRDEVTASWRHNLGLLSRLYSAIVDRTKEKTDIDDASGKEFFVIARKDGGAVSAT